MTALNPLLERTKLTAVPKSRLESLDLFRGLAILAVVGIHVSGHALRIPGLSAGVLEILQTLNRLLQFAVPGFLFMTALVFAYQYAHKPLELGTFYRKRLTSVVQPYLVWTVLYALFTALATRLTLPNLLEPRRWLEWILTGKAFFHLYFMVIVIQFYLLFPLLMPAFKKRTRFEWRSSVLTLLSIVALQIGFYWLNRLYFRIPNIGSVVLWHTVPLGLGLFIGSSLPDWPRLWVRARVLFLALLVLAVVWYTPIALSTLRGSSVNTFAAALSGWLYSGTVALLMLGLCTWLEGRFNLSRPRFYTALLTLGAYSLQIYLIHPAVMKVLEFLGKHGLSFLERLSGHVLVYLLAVLIPLGFGYLVRGTTLSKVLFGR